MLTFVLRLLLPGGDVDIQTSQFTRAAKILYSLALKVRGLKFTPSQFKLKLKSTYVTLTV